jgi:putative membrane protein insertion efficiency factor
VKSCVPRDDFSFSEEKEAKRLLSVSATRGVDRFARGQVAKVFCSFFSKKECSPSPAARVLIQMTRAYQLTLGSVLGGQCRFTPSCSAYAMQAFATHGATRGAALAATRILRCSPLCAGGHDPVPPARHTPNPETA